MPYPGDSPITLTSPAPGLTKTIPAYRYWEYSDDDDLAGLFDAYNQLVQEYINWFCYVVLPVYTGPYIAGALLDWVGKWLYGWARPVLPVAGEITITGPFNTFLFNTETFNGGSLSSNISYNPVTDDFYKRVLTWNTFPGDGKVFTPRWLKRRIMRFLYGQSGTDTPKTATSPQVSVAFGVDNNVTITLLAFTYSIINQALFNGFGFNELPFNAGTVVKTPLTPLPNADILKTAIDTGVCVLPFQYSYTVVVQTPP